MIRMSNQEQFNNVVYVEKPVIHTVEVPKIVFQDREVPVEKLVIQQSDQTAMKEWTHRKIQELNTSIMLCLHDNKDLSNQKFDMVKTTLDMQSRALVGLKAQRDIDRKRRLQLIQRLKKEKQTHQQELAHFKWKIYCVLFAISIALIFK